MVINLPLNKKNSNLQVIKCIITLQGLKELVIIVTISKDNFLFFSGAQRLASGFKCNTCLIIGYAKITNFLNLQIFCTDTEKTR